jgi:4-alpha-glucanotransferase
MTFGLIGWLKSQHNQIDYEIPVWFPKAHQLDNREWLITNGLGGYSSGTVSGLNRRKYHATLVSALKPPLDRQVVLSRVEEVVTINGVKYDLATDAWASGVISPMGYKHIGCFTNYPTPTWVYELGGHYLVKRLALSAGREQIVFGYTFLPDPSKRAPHCQLSVRFLVGFRNHHLEVKGSSQDTYPQFVSPHQSLIILNDSGYRLCLTWQRGDYEAQRQWWWDYSWPEETLRCQPDKEDLFLVGSLTTLLKAEEEFSLGASFEEPMLNPNCAEVVNEILQRQKTLIHKASLPRSQATDLLILACDNFLVNDVFSKESKPDLHEQTLLKEPPTRLSVMEGYPWFNDSGRAALFGLAGLTLTVRRFEQARAILSTFAHRRNNGLIANRSLETSRLGGAEEFPGLEFTSLDVTLAYALALYRYYRLTKDKSFTAEMLPVLFSVYEALSSNAIDSAVSCNFGIKLDLEDGLLTCGLPYEEFTWMDCRVAQIPITPRAGKAVEINALWYSFLKTLVFLCEECVVANPASEAIDRQIEVTAKGMTRFWNEAQSCLYDVLDCPDFGKGDKDGRQDTIRPNQIFAVSLPFRVFTKEQEKLILQKVEDELLTPYGLRSLSIKDSQYQAKYGCGFEHADQYHRDLSYHQGCAWTWLIGPYIEALINIYPLPETAQKVRLILQPILAHMLNEACLGNISEIFDGTTPHIARGCPAHALAVAEVMRWQGWLLRQ